VQWHERPREKDGPEREERQKFAHASTVLWRPVTAS
jgi:hypothetical protein